MAFDKALKYSLVEFTEEKSVQVVPTIWMKSASRSTWPPYVDAARCRNAAKVCEIPGSMWVYYPSKVWYQSGK